MPLEFFSNQAAVAIENADLYTNLEALVAERTEALIQANKTLEEKVIARTEALTKINETLKSEIVERKQADVALQESEERLKLAIQAGRLGTWDWQIPTGQVIWSDNVEDIFGLEPGTFGGTFEAFMELVHPYDREHVLQAIQAGLDGHPDYYIEHRALGQNGFVHWIEGTGKIYYDDSYQPVRMLGAVQNITERKLAEGQIKASLQEKEVLLKEIHHRVKNNLQVISSLLDLQSSYIADEVVKEMFQESRRRVRSMALVHEQLYQSADLARIEFADYVDDLVGYLGRVYGNMARGVMIEADISRVALSVETAVPLGLIINELVSNAYKHAFPDGRSGQIHIGLQIRGDNQFCLSVQDNGIGFPADINFRRSPSLGLTIIMTLVDQLRGQIELISNIGTHFELTFLSGERDVEIVSSDLGEGEYSSMPEGNEAIQEKDVT